MVDTFCFIWRVKN